MGSAFRSTGAPPRLTSTLRLDTNNESPDRAWQHRIARAVPSPLHVRVVTRTQSQYSVATDPSLSVSIVLFFESPHSKEHCSSMNELLPYVQELEQQIQVQPFSWTHWTEWCELSLNNGPAIELRQASGSHAQKAQGAFFTSASLAARAVSALGVSVHDSGFYFDPACGAGDLLLAIAKKMKLGSTVTETLAIWGNQLIGCDLSSVFVRAARARLALLAMQRTGYRESFTSKDLANLLPSITTADIHDCPDLYSKSARVVMNPPYVPVTVSKDCRWSSGLTNAAACFMADAISHSESGTRIVAILPDVIRSGTRYERWRTMVSRLAQVDHVELCGLFDKNADVDVFLLGVTVQDCARTDSVRWTQDRDIDETVSDRFIICVGTVVPHRDPEEGVEHPYVDVRSLSPWSTRLLITNTRRYAGRVFRPPFVAIRRTSSPRDHSRAVATTVVGTRDVAVENHVIVCIPYDRSVESCQHLVARLMSRKTDQWLNGRIRCRHLTVGAVGGLPWWTDDQF